MQQKTVLLGFFLLWALVAQGKDDKVVLKEFKSVYEFSLNKRTGEPMVRESLEMFFEALGPNAQIVVPSFYDESSVLADAQLLDNRNKRATVGKVCGNYEDRDIFYSDLQFCAYKFSIGNKGETARFSTNKEYNNPRYFTSVYFPSNYQVQQRIVEFHVPAWLNLELKEFNFDGFAIKRSQQLDARKNVTIIRYELTNLNAYEEGNYLPGKSHTYPHLLPIIASYEHNASKKVLMSNTSDLYRWYSNLVKEVQNDTSPLKPKVAELIRDKATDQEKIAAIYYWVQDNIRYIAFEEGIAGFKPESCQKVYQNRYGDCKGMANLTKQMLLLAGYDARLGWIGTSHLAYTYEIPSLAVDNHMICVVLLGKDTLTLDATEKFIGLRDVGERIQGKELLIENGEQYFIHQVPRLSHKRNTREKRYSLAIAEGALKGKGKVSLQGERRTAILQACNGVRNEGSENLLKRSIVGESKNMLVQQLEYSSLSERNKPFTVDFAFQLQNNLTEYGGEYYVQLDFTPDFLGLEMEEERINPLDFNEKINQHTEVRLALPAGYKVSYLPKDVRIETKEFSFILTYKTVGKELVFSKQILIPEGKISKSAFPDWNNALKSLQQQAQEQITLSKK